VTELLVGVPFPSLAFEILRFAVPAANLAEFAYSGATYPTDAALDRGWVDELAEPAELLEDARAVARELAEISPAAFAQTKAQMRAPVAERFAVGGAVTDKTVTDIWCAPETLARVTDYVERVLRR
jgi:enoyl-CoA hydratase